jgi:hypothetical protein
MNEEVAKWLGLGVKCRNHGTYLLTKSELPDFSTDAGAVQLLREMKKRGDYTLFIFWMWSKYSLRLIDTYDIITTPAALLRAVFEWIGKEKP